MGLAAFAAAVSRAALPGAAAAHGPVEPMATSYFAQLSHVPNDLDAKVVDGYVRVWLSVPASLMSVRGAGR